jgi:hypothetical protein
MEKHPVLERPIPAELWAAASEDLKARSPLPQPDRWSHAVADAFWQVVGARRVRSVLRLAALRRRA